MKKKKYSLTSFHIIPHYSHEISLKYQEHRKWTKNTGCPFFSCTFFSYDRIAFYGNNLIKQFPLIKKKKSKIYYVVMCTQSRLRKLVGENKMSIICELKYINYSELFFNNESDELIVIFKLV